MSDSTSFDGELNKNGNDLFWRQKPVIEQSDNDINLMGCLYIISNRVTSKQTIS